jgi:NADPH:quinone reductase-like Zn-dependent oxidoreductase
MRKVSAIIYHQHGDPANVVRVEKKSVASPAMGEALVEVQAAPINPADLNVIEGKYPRLPPLPAVAGVEGMGVVSALGPGTMNLRVGAHVLLPWGAGSWSEACVVPVDQLIPIPVDIPFDQASMLRVNPPTAWRLLHDFLALRPGDWIIQNGANSAVGLAVIQIARVLGLRTVNVVRRPELVTDLRAEGGNVALVEGEDLPKQVAEATGNANIYLGFNCIGGESALQVAKSLAQGGTLVTYGAMARQPMRIPTGLLVFKDLTFRGFWITQWMQRAKPQEITAMFDCLFPLARSSVLRTKIEKTYALKDARDAIIHAQQGGRAGKILFKF